MGTPISLLETIQDMSADIPPAPPRLTPPPPPPPFELPSNHRITRDEWLAIQGLRKRWVEIRRIDYRKKYATPKAGGHWQISIFPEAIRWSRNTSKDDRAKLIKEENELFSAFRKQARALGLKQDQIFKGRFIVAVEKWPTVQKALRGLFADMKAFNKKAKRLGTDRNWVLVMLNLEEFNKSSATMLREAVAKYLPRLDAIQ